MSLEIRATPEGQSTTNKLTPNLKKFFSILEGDELVMVTKAGFNDANFSRDMYKGFVPGFFVYEVDDNENPTYYKELRWQADKDSTFPLTGAIGTDFYMIQLANQT